MSESYILWRWIRRFLLALLLASIVMWFETQADGRPRYTLIDIRASFLFSNSDELPFELLDEMCWNATEGFCDAGLQNNEEIFYLIDWQSETYGAIFETQSGACFWWMYQETWGTDGNPHVAEHYWIECP